MVGAAALLVSGCGSTDASSRQPVQRKAAAFTDDIVVSVCNGTPDVVRVDLQSATHGVEDLKKGSCVNSQPPDAGGADQFDLCGLTTFIFPPPTASPTTYGVVLFQNNWSLRGFEVLTYPGRPDYRADEANNCWNAGSRIKTDAGGPAAIAEVTGYLMKVEQRRNDRYVYFDATLYPKGTAPSAMR